MIRTRRASESDLILVPLFLAPFLVFLPLGFHPRVASLFWVSFAFLIVVLLTRTRSELNRDLSGMWLPVGVATYGAVISGDWVSALWGDLSRHAGALDWAFWGVMSLMMPSVLRGRWDSVLWGLGVVGAGMGLFSLFGDVSGGRAMGLTANPGILGFWCMIGGIASMSLVWTSGDNIRRALLTAAMLSMCLTGLILSETRAGMVGLAFALPLVMGRRWLLTLSAGFWALLLAWALLINHAGADAQRMDMWGFVLASWGLLGSGLGTFRDAYQGSVQDFPHSMPLQMLWEFGLLGAALVGAFVNVGFWNLRGPWLALFVGFSIYSLFWFPSPAWFFVGVLLIARMRTKEAI